VSNYQKFGAGFLLLAIGMFVLGIGMFTYQGPPLNPIVFTLAEYSFLWWFPVLLLGISLLRVGKD